jgi:hypothetical protein
MLESAAETLNQYNAFMTVLLKLELKLALFIFMVLEVYYSMRRTGRPLREKRGYVRIGSRRKRRREIDEGRKVIPRQDSACSNGRRLSRIK